MSSNRRYFSGVRPLSGLFAFLAVLCLTGCYTRQIEGIQSDLDTLDRKLHSLNLKKTQTDPEGAKGNVLHLEDQLNRVTLQQADAKDELAALHQEYNDFKAEFLTKEPGPLSSSNLDSADARRIEKSMEETRRQSGRIEERQKKLEDDLAKLRTDTREVIGLLMEEVSPEGGQNPATGPEVKGTGTEVEGPGESESNPFPKGEETLKVGKTHTVSPGESLTSIARKFGLPPETLQKLNKIENPNDLKMGQTIYLPEVKTDL